MKPRRSLAVGLLDFGCELATYAVYSPVVQGSTSDRSEAGSAEATYSMSHLLLR